MSSIIISVSTEHSYVTNHSPWGIKTNSCQL